MGSDTHNPRVQVRAEEVIIGALVGIGTAVAATSPVTLGLPVWNPLDAPGWWSFVQAATLWSSILAGGILGAHLASHQERDSHVRGARYLPNYRDARHALQTRQAEQFSVSQQNRDVQGLRIGGVELARTQETRHLVCVGTTGAGKTAFLTSLIDQALERGDRLLIHDPKGDYSAKYFDPATTVMLGPWDARAVMWDAATDIATPALADEFGAATAGKVEGQNKSFFDNAGRIIAGTIKAYMAAGQPWSWADLAKWLSADPRDLALWAAQGDPGVRSAIPSAFRDPDKPLSNGDTSTLSIVASATKWIANYAAVDHPGACRFSIVNWLLQEAHNETRIVFLNSNAQYQSAAEAIFGSVLNAAVAVVNSAQMPERSQDAAAGIWMVLDELPQMGTAAMLAMQKIYELGRSRGIRAVLAMQDESQLAAVLGGSDKARPMLNVQGTRIYMQCSAATADEVSRRVGEREVNRIETTAEGGALPGKSKKHATQRVIQPSDLTGLHPRIATPPLGIELVLHIDDTLGRLLHPFPPRRPDRAAALEESDAWRFGTLPQQQSNGTAIAKSQGSPPGQAPQSTGTPPTPPAHAQNDCDDEDDSPLDLTDESDDIRIDL